MNHRLRIDRTCRLIACFFWMSASIVAAPPDNAPREIIFETRATDTHLEMTCKAFDAEVARDTKWIDSCNRVGRMAIDQAVESGLIAPVEDPAFGQSSVFTKSLPPDLSATTTLSRKFPLIVPTL
jgi:hypothetical protein